MSSHQWRAVYRAIQRVRRLPRPSRKPLCNDALIVAMYFWSVLHDRPLGSSQNHPLPCPPRLPRKGRLMQAQTQNPVALRTLVVPSQLSRALVRPASLVDWLRYDSPVRI
jgi:hypothetical protein